MAKRIVAIERTGSATPELADWQSITVRDDAANAQPVFGHVHVYGIGDDGSRHSLFAYYSDEVSYSPDELACLFIDTTPGTARSLAARLHATKDAAFLLGREG